jgi:hypothetical protein
MLKILAGDHRKLTFSESITPSASKEGTGTNGALAGQEQCDAKSQSDTVARSVTQDEVIRRFEWSDMRPCP